jgi:hypothetical protein
MIFMKNAKGRIFFVLALLLGSSLQAAENYSQWKYYRDINLGKNLSATNKIINFPLLVRLTDADSIVFNNARRKGADIRFSAFPGNGNTIRHFPYQIEY